METAGIKVGCRCCYKNFQKDATAMRFCGTRAEKNARGHNLGKLFLELQNAGLEFQIPNEEILKGKIKSIKTVAELTQQN